MKLDNFQTAIEGRPVYKATLSKNQGYALGALLLVGASVLVWYKYIRDPQLNIYNVDAANDKAKVGVDNSKSMVLIKAGQTVPLLSNLHSYKVTAEVVKDDTSNLTTGMKFKLVDAKGKTISEKSKAYTS